ncbi:MAG TPA: 4Fe-4S double cluster binding domain-containing protein [Methanomassiliicoccales archaeon]|nr:4Fe-4S double cluster binding domain-containing protein [Methanomassiliicoccales archaeon]
MQAGAELVLDALRTKGMRASILPIGRLVDLERDVRSLLDSGAIGADFYKENFGGFKFELPLDFADAKSIVIVATPAPILVTSFALHGKRVEAIIPPTYGQAVPIREAAKRALTEASAPSTFRFEFAVLPCKTLAVRSGLARYGRNNVTYVDGMGSFHRLTAFFSDLRVETDTWRDREQLPECKGCMRCMRNCPTGAIAKDRFLLHAERCLTYLNELPKVRPFPERIRKDMHNAIVGCMRCQNVCPADMEVIDKVLDVDSFTEQETAFLLAGSYDNDEGKRILAKLQTMGLDLSIFPRNLAALL